MKVSIGCDPSFLGTRVFLYEDKPDGRYIVKPQEWVTERLDYGLMPEPTFRFDERGGDEFLHSFADALAEAGFRPDEMKANNKQVEAIKEHLTDMRRLVFDNKEKMG